MVITPLGYPFRIRPFCRGCIINTLKLRVQTPLNGWLEYVGIRSFRFGALPIFQGLLLLVSGSVNHENDPDDPSPTGHSFFYLGG